MAKQKFELEASLRTTTGKGASRRLRRLENAVPAIIYGGDKEPANISLDHDKILHATENEAFFTSIVSLKVDGTPENVIIKDLQRHPAKPRIIHADFQRVSEDHQLHVHIPLHFINEATCVGVKQGGGKISHLINELEVTCLPKDLPEYIEVDVQNLEVGDSLHISDLKLPEGVHSVALSHGEESDHAVVSVIVLRGAEVEETEAGEAAAGEEPAPEGKD